MDVWITEFIESAGYLGVALLMIAENVFPPIPSELVMPFAGFSAARGALSLPGAIVAGTMGSLLGALPWYAAGRWVGEGRLERFAARHGRWLTLTPADVAGAQRWFGRHCGKGVLFGRLVPAVRTLISVPAGVARMSLARFLALSAAGSLLWTGALAGLGYALGGQYGRIAGVLGPVTNTLVGILVVAYLYRVVRWTPRGARAPSGPR